VNAVEFDRVSKSYSIYEAPGDRLKELAFLGARSFHREFRALRDVSFSVRRGEVFCIIGENGSGKSTSLQLMAGILQPTAGELRVNGRVAALLELGAGFNAEFTGRENVYLNGALMGLSKRQMDSRFQAIEEFAGIGDFIQQPVKTYSSGMVMRLAFAVAIHVDPEILLVDEALAVGDTSFRHRCMRKVHELRARGVTIVFVSHSVADVKAIGERALWLQHLAAITETAGPASERTVMGVKSIPNIDHRHGDGRAEILGIAILNEFGEPLHMMEPESRIVVRISLRAHGDLRRPDAGFMLRNHLGIDFAQTSAAGEGHGLPPMHAGDTVTVDYRLDIPELYPGAFSFSPWICDEGDICDWIDNAITVQMARGELPVYGYLHWPCRVEMNAALEQGID
jgi:ABC-type polysaccharide/polyol phosphate transport system ATPase subunit